MEEVNEERPFGDYVPGECLAESRTTRTWLAEQVSVGRKVLIEELKPEAMSECGAFLADVRAKAAVEHPLVGSVYEAFSGESNCFFAHELLPGATLDERKRAGETIRPQRFVHNLRRIADANIYHETHDNATSPLGLDAIHIDSQGVVRIKNLAVDGTRLADHSRRDVMKLGAAFEGTLDLDLPGATRCLTLLAWMRGEEVPEPLRWTEVREYCEQIEQQLAEPLLVTAPPTAAMRPGKKSGFVWVVGALLLVVAVAAFLLFQGTSKPAVKNNVAKPDWVALQAGEYKMPEGTSIGVESFQISAYEVTIGEYAGFLETLELLADEDKTIFDHPAQPEAKEGHLPEDWASLHGAAKVSGEWGGYPVTLDTPVVGVDWWDASAYAKWKRAALPTQEQWLAALLAGDEEPSAIPISGWLPVTAETVDRLSNGILGMAGSVSEWTSEPRPSPANPLGAPLWIIMGGSYKNPAKGASSREWVDDRSLRRPDLGFRICENAN